MMVRAVTVVVLLVAAWSPVAPQCQKSESLNYTDTSPRSSRCEVLDMLVCENPGYNMTILPNLLGHATQREARVELEQFIKLVNVECSPDLLGFLCLVYAPVCSILDRPIPPCRSLCLSAKEGCECLMNQFGLKWPDKLECSKFPETVEEALCVSSLESKGSV